MKELERLLGKAIYEGLRCRLKGKLKVEIRNDECYVEIKFDDYTYYTIYEGLSDSILSGKFTSAKIVEDFIKNWKRYYFTIQEKRLFYPVLPEEKG